VPVADLDILGIDRDGSLLPLPDRSGQLGQYIKRHWLNWRLTCCSFPLILPSWEQHGLQFDYQPAYLQAMIPA
jgi:hypothetical protein